jgi:hypothetical protein
MPFWGVLLDSHNAPALNLMYEYELPGGICIVTWSVHHDDCQKDFTGAAVMIGNEIDELPIW